MSMPEEHVAITFPKASFVCLAALLFVNNTSAFGQIEWGLKAGINSDVVQTNGLKTTDPVYGRFNVGYHAGALGRMPIENGWSLIGEIQFVRRSVGGIYPQLPVRQRTSFEYFDIAMLPALSLSKAFLIEAGPSFEIQTRLFDSEPELFPQRLVQFGFNAGTRFTTEKGLFFNVRYYHALTPFDTLPRETPTQSVGVSQYFYRSFQISIGYTFKREG